MKCDKQGCDEDMLVFARGWPICPCCDETMSGCPERKHCIKCRCGLCLHPDPTGRYIGGAVTSVVVPG